MREHGLSMRETAAHFNIHAVSSVSLWERCYDEGGLQALIPKKKRETICNEANNNKVTTY